VKVPESSASANVIAFTRVGGRGVARGQIRYTRTVQADATGLEPRSKDEPTSLTTDDPFKALKGGLMKKSGKEGA